MLGLLILVSCGGVEVDEGAESELANDTASATATLDYINVTPGTSIIDINASVQMVATGIFTDNTSENLSASVDWSVDNPAVASISDDGLLQGLAAGTVTVTASDGQYSDSAVVTVNTNAISPQSISVTAPTTNNTMQAGSSMQLDAFGDFGSSGTTNINNSVVWSVSDPAIASVSSTGVLTALSNGVVTVTATSGSVSQSITVTVGAIPVQVTLDSIVLTPTSSVVDEGATIQFIATGNYSDNSTQNLNSSANWSVSDPTIASINASGLLTALSAGVVTVTATDGAISNNATVTINAVTSNPPAVSMVSMSVTPATSSVIVGETVQLSATGTWSDNSTANINSLAIWSVSDSSIATVSSTGLVTAISTGVVAINAVSGSFSDSVTVEINAAPVVDLQSINVSASTSSAEVGEAVQLTAIANYSDNSTDNVTNSVAWSVSDSAVASVSSNGVLTLLGAGVVTVTATDGTVSSAISVTVNAAPVTLDSIVVTPTGSTVPEGGSQQFIATGNYSDGSTQNLSSTVTWNVSDNPGQNSSEPELCPNTVFLDGYIYNGELEYGLNSCSAEGQVCTTTTYFESVLDHVPAACQNGLWVISTGDASAPSTASSTESGVATIDPNGLLTAISAGDVSVTATNGTLGDSVLVTIEALPVTLQSITITPENSTIEVDNSVQFVATGTYSDGSTAILDGSTVELSVDTWTVTGGITANFGPNGLITPSNTGAGTVSATLNGITGSTSLTVTAAQVILQSIAVTPGSGSVEVGESLQFAATGTYSDNSTANITNSVAWSVDAGIASVDSNGLLTTSSDGTVTVTAASGALNDSAVVTVNPVAVTLQSISVSPASVSITAGAAQQLIAIATYSDASTVDVSNSVTWMSIDNAIATISAAGVLTGDSVGETDVTASIGGTSSNIVPVTISAPVSASLMLSEISEGGYGNGFWFEIYNPSTVAVDLGQYAIKSGNLTTGEALPTKLVPPGAYLVIMTQDLFDSLAFTISYEGSPNVVILDEQNFGWNSSGYLELLEGTETVDFVRFGSNNTAPTTASAWNGGAAPALTNNFDYHQSIARDTAHTDTDSASDWSLKEYSSIGGPNDITCITDADSDGIPDCSEMPGSTFAGMDLYAMGARVNQIDLFVEIDYMDPAGTTDTNIEGMLPQREVLDKITAEFLAHGFHVHFDVGDYFDQNPGIDPLDYDLGGGDFVPFAEEIMFRFFAYPDNSHLDPDIADIFVYKAEHMELKRRPIFYYIVFAYSHAQGASGVSEVNGNDSFIALGNWNLNRDDDLKTNQLINFQSGTLMHEFGHALGLSHGGFEGTNHKPNYHSTMNYMYATNGLPVLGTNDGDRYYLGYNSGTTGNFDCKIGLGTNTLVNGPFDDWTQFGLGFSDGSSVDLDEATGVSEALGYGRTGGSSVDFNCDGDTDDVLTDFDLNSDEVLEILKDYDDWGNIRTFFSQDLRHIANGVSGNVNPAARKVWVGKDWGRQPEIYAEPRIPNRKEKHEREYRKARERADKKRRLDALSKQR